MKNLTVEDIKNAINGTEFEFYGLRVDEGICYNVGDTVAMSKPHEIEYTLTFYLDTAVKE